MSDAERPRLGDFDLGDVLGESAAAVVFRARHRASGVEVALKRWRRPFDPAREHAFREGCRVHRQLSGHPNIVRLYGEAPPAPTAVAGEAPRSGPAWVATEIAEESLAELLRRGPVPVDRAWRIAVDLLRGLAAVHERAVAHRGVKPSNILLLGGRAMLGEFGVAGPADRRSDVRAAGMLLGALFPEPRPAALRPLLDRATGAGPAGADVLLAGLEAMAGGGSGPGNIGGEPEQREQPGNAGEGPGRPENAGGGPGQPRNAGGEPGQPGNAGREPGRPENVGGGSGRPENVGGGSGRPENVGGGSGRPENAGVFRTEPGGWGRAPARPRNAARRPTSGGELPANLHRPAPASRRENAGTFPARPAPRPDGTGPGGPSHPGPRRFVLAAVAIAVVAAVTVALAHGRQPNRPAAPADSPAPSVAEHGSDRPAAPPAASPSSSGP